MLGWVTVDELPGTVTVLCIVVNGWVAVDEAIVDGMVTVDCWVTVDPMVDVDPG